MISVESLREVILSELDLSKEVQDNELLSFIDEVIIKNSREKYLSIFEKEKLRKELFDSIRGFDILQELLEDNSITEIMVNGPEHIFIEKNGSIYESPGKFISEVRLRDVIQQIVSRVNRRVNEASPIVDARLEDGSRINIVLPPVALNGPILTIRKFPEQKITIETLIKSESITNEGADFLKKLVIAGYNIFVSGGTGSGKTTFLNVLSDFIPEDERVITIEDSAELQLSSIRNLVRLEVREPNTEGENGISIRSLIKSSLRMRPDRIIVGEVRGGECLDMLQAMNTGHDGSLSTGHANSPKDMLSRLETMVLMGVDMPLPAIKAQIAAGIDLIVHLGRLRDKSRRVLEIVEVTGYCNGEIEMNSLYQFCEEGETLEGKIKGKLIRTDNKLVQVNKLQQAGLHWI